MRDLWIIPMVMQSPGKDSIVLDKAAKTQFIRPGRVKVSAEFGTPPELPDDPRNRAEGGEKGESTLCADVIDTYGRVVAHINQALNSLGKDTI